MKREGEEVLALVMAQSSALSAVNSTSLAQRGVQDYLASEQAERYLCEGREHYYREEFEEAIACLRLGLNLNPSHAEMRCVIGLAYLGRGVPSADYKEAHRHLSIAAHDGNAEAQSELAQMYLDGQGVAQDYGRAFFWRERAAKQGHPCDQRKLGRMYEHGVGVEQDHQQAIFWYQKAADQGGYFERSQITDLQKRVIGQSGGWCKVSQAPHSPHPDGENS